MLGNIICAVGQRFSAAVKFKRFFSDSARRYVDNAFQAHGVFVVEQQADIGKNVFYLFAFIEFHSTKYPIWDIFADERLFKESRLSVSTVNDSEIRITTRLTISYHIGNEICFMFFIDSFEYYDFFTYWIRGKKSLFHLIGIIFDHSIRCIDDNLS